MSYYLAAAFIEGQQFTNAGQPLNGGMIYTYLAGTSTLTATYTSNTGSVANSNPIVLNAYGRLTTQIWMPAGQDIKFVLTDASNNVLETHDNVPSIVPSAYFTGTQSTAGSVLMNTTITNAAYPLVLSPEVSTGYASPLFNGNVTYNPGTNVLTLSGNGNITANTITSTFVGNTATQAIGNSSNLLASTAFVQQQIAPQIQSIGASVASNALTVTYAGAQLAFRNPTLANGAPVSATVSAQNLTVYSSATLGTVSGQQSQIMLVVLYNNGSPALGVVNIAGAVNLDETTLVTSTASSVGSTSANGIYTATTISTPTPFRVIGTVISTQATAGTWATAPSLVQGTGGEALAAMQSLGYGQTWQTQTPSRVSGTTYYNTTSRPISVEVTLYVSSGSSGYTVVKGGISTTVSLTGLTAGFNPVVSFICPPGNAYSITVNAGTTISAWLELR